MAKIRVKIDWTVEVDTDAWASEYGTDPSAKAVRQDVKAYFETGEIIPEHLRDAVRAVRLGG